MMRTSAQEARRAGAAQMFLGRLSCLLGVLNIANATYGLIMDRPQPTLFILGLSFVLYILGERYRRRALAHISEAIAQEFGLRPAAQRLEPGSVQHSGMQTLLARCGMLMGVALAVMGASNITATLIAVGKELRTEERTADWTDLMALSASMAMVVAVLFSESRIYAMMNAPQGNRPGFFRPVTATVVWGMLSLLPLGYVCVRAASTGGEPTGTDIFPVYGVVALLATLCADRANRVFRLVLRARSSRVVNSPDEVQPYTFSLLLRSFGEDTHLGRDQQVFTTKSLVKRWFSIGISEERKICSALDWVGPMIAVGVPGERLAPDGAARFYLPRHQWHAPVGKLMLRARLVVLILGDSESVAWELAEAFRTVPPERLVLIVPVRASGYTTLKRNLREALRQHLRATEPVPEFPDYGGGFGLSSRAQGIIYFTPGWRPIYTPLRAGFEPTDRLVLALSRASGPVAAQLREYESGMPPDVGKQD